MNIIIVAAYNAYNELQQLSRELVTCNNDCCYVDFELA